MTTESWEAAQNEQEYVGLLEHDPSSGHGLNSEDGLADAVEG